MTTIPLEKQFEKLLVKLYGVVAEAKTFENRIDEKGQSILIEFIELLNKKLECEIRANGIDYINRWLTDNRFKMISPNFNHWNITFEGYELYITFIINHDLNRAKSFLQLMGEVYNNRDLSMSPWVTMKDMKNREIPSRKFTIPRFE